jgi:hypothetical protein
MYTVVVIPITTYAVMIWWPTVKCRTRQAKLSKVQRLACVGTMGTTGTAPTATKVVFLGLSSLHAKREAKARAGICRLSCIEQWKSRRLGHGHTGVCRDMMNEPSANGV